MDQRPVVDKVPLILITGFLGSGKTSLIIDLLQRYSDTYRMAIVQNEFAPGKVDGITLRQTKSAFNLLEVNNGSLFCACQLGDFITRLEPFLEEARPDVILLEATGLADPVSMGQILHSDRMAGRIYLAAAWCVVDAVNFLKIINTVSRSRQQVRLADLVFINKTDLVSDTSEVRSKILEINPMASIIETSFGSAVQIDLVHLIASGSRSGIKGFGLDASEGRPGVGSCVVRSSRPFDAVKVEHFIREQAPRLIRMKGYIRIDHDQTLHVQTIYQDIKILVINDYEGSTELIALGEGLNAHEFSKQFLALGLNR